jgi:hypothetical protein
LEVDDARVRFELMSATGQSDGEDTYELEAIFRLDESSEYMKRLSLLTAYDVADEDGEETEKPAEIAMWLEEAVASSEIVDIARIDDPRQVCRVIRVEDGWVDFEILGDDPRNIEDRVASRQSLVSEVRRRSGVLRAVNQLLAER